MPSNKDAFAAYCCELLASVGPCVAKRMFGGFGISTDGLTLAIVADLGEGDALWLKADDDCRARFEAAGCARFVYQAKGKAMGMNYYRAPDEAMESSTLMAPWARLSLACALKARAAKPTAPRKAKASAAVKPAKPRRGR